MQFWSHNILSHPKSDRSEKLLHQKWEAILVLQLILPSNKEKCSNRKLMECGCYCSYIVMFHFMFTLQTKRSKSAWQVKSMDKRKSASFCTTEMQRSCASVKGSGSISGVSFAVDTSVSKEERGHSAVRRRRIKSLKCCRNSIWNNSYSLKLIS